ncbi:60S acidic ribosomal protein P2-4 [Striga hermonthica]|uniref:60S acidic ribosomal protein P2-4 n=1 Tax=Striga hermonthica TaxID=68872 RepID=A0A9N7P143_STRHE|nr:60S acidic ribosomal protein P2-4 [Striga hermonthica]
MLSLCCYPVLKSLFFLLVGFCHCSSSKYCVGAEAEDEKIELLLSQVKGKDITELIASGREKLASVPSGGGAVAVAAPTGGAAAPAAAAETKKEEKVEEKEESDDDLGFSLFD